MLQEEDVVSWDSDELNRIHNLHIREFQDIAVRQINNRVVRLTQPPAAAPSVPQPHLSCDVCDRATTEVARLLCVAV